MRILCLFLFTCFSLVNHAQYKSFSLTEKGDTINGVNKDGQKIGKWLYRFEELRGEPGYEEEGVYVKGQKHGYWRRYSLQGDLVAVEHYILGGKDGLQQYYSFVGNLEREENWKGYNPDSPYDTIPVYGEGSNEILRYNIVKAEPYAVKHGAWKFYDEEGRIIRTEMWDRNRIAAPQNEKTEVVTQTKPKKPEKTPEMLEWELKNKGKKGAIRDGKTGL